MRLPRVLAVAGSWNSLGAAERRARDAVAADHLLLLEHPDAIPELDVHADRADDQVRAAGGPRRLAAAAPDPDQLVHHGAGR